MISWIRFSLPSSRVAEYVTSSSCCQWKKHLPSMGNTGEPALSKINKKGTLKCLHPEQTTSLNITLLAPRQLLNPPPPSGLTFHSQAVQVAQESSPSLPSWSQPAQWWPPGWQDTGPAMGRFLASICSSRSESMPGVNTSLGWMLVKPWGEAAPETAPREIPHILLSFGSSLSQDSQLTFKISLNSWPIYFISRASNLWKYILKNQTECTLLIAGPFSDILQSK